MERQSDLEAKVLAILEKTVQRKIGLDEELLNSGLIDSISAVDVALTIESEFNIQISATEIADCLSTAQTLINHVRTHGG